MCGGLVAAFGLGPGRRGGTGFQALYHLGRITTYAALGAALAWAGG
ncbi:MAG: sulfite exporter TauE/SafE family protein, partial [Candidatus Dadabacteria bacterium]